MRLRDVVDDPDETCSAKGPHGTACLPCGAQYLTGLWRQRALDAWRTAGIGVGDWVLELVVDRVTAHPTWLNWSAFPDGSWPSTNRTNSSEHSKLTVMSEESRTLRSAPPIWNAREFPNVMAQHTWCRWVFAFVKHPRAILARMARALAPGELSFCTTILTIPHGARYRAVAKSKNLSAQVMASWRHNGDEPDIALSLPSWLEELGFEVLSAHPILDMAQPNQVSWDWLATFREVGRWLLVDLDSFPPIVLKLSCGHSLNSKRHREPAW
jgi:hypothetical protein